MNATAAAHDAVDYDELHNPPPLPEPDSEPDTPDEPARVIGTIRPAAAIPGPSAAEPEPGAPLPITLADFLARKLPPREVLLAPWLPAKGLAMIYAARGVGKTHVALAVAYAVACGGEALGWRAPISRRVLYIDGEMPAPAMQERLAMLVATTGTEPPTPDHFRLLANDLSENGLPDLSTEDGQALLAPACEGSDLIVLDNLSTLCRTGRENESESWNVVQPWLLAQRRAGRSVLLIHHAGKGGDQRGTSKREDVLDSVLRLDRPDDYEASEGARFNVTFTKTRGFTGDAANPLEARFADGRWTTRPLADALAQRIYALADEGMSQREIATEIGKGVGTVNRHLKRREAAQ